MKRFDDDIDILRRARSPQQDGDVAADDSMGNSVLRKHGRFLDDECVELAWRFVDVNGIVFNVHWWMVG